MPLASTTAGSIRRVALVALLGVVIAIAVSQRSRFDAASLLHWRDVWRAWSADHAAAAAVAFVLLYVTLAALSVPIGGGMTLLAGALFGVGVGTVLASFASTAGATLAMLLSRYVFRAAVRRRFAAQVQALEGQGASALFSLRLIPAVPFFVVNLVMGLTAIPVPTFALVSQLGMLPATLLYANAGGQLDTVHGLGDILTPRMIAAFLALAALPFALKGGRSWWSGRARRRRWPRPPRFDYNLIVIGAGSAGLVSASIAAAAGARVALIEAGPMGGDCLNTGCVPSKALIRSARLVHEGRHPGALGATGRLDPDFPAVMARIARVIARIAPHDSVERYRALGVEVIPGRARVTSPWTVAVGDRVLTGRRLVIATGAGPAVPAIPGLDAVAPLTSETLWTLTQRPGRLLVVGGGAIGCELAQAFARLGTHVTLVEVAPRLVTGEDDDVSAAVRAVLEADGVDVLTGAAVQRVATEGSGCRADLADGRTIGFDRVLLAVGKTPRTTGFGLEELGLLDRGRLVTDERLRTRCPSIYAAGDVLGRLQYTHAASHYAWFAATNALFGRLLARRVRTPAFPRVIYTDPEVARVGMTETEAAAAGQPVEVTRLDLGELDRAVVDGAETGFVKVLTARGSDRILGATIVGARAGDMLGAFTFAMANGLGLGAVLKTIVPYPGWGEGARTVAGRWRRAHLPGVLTALSRRLLRWQRG